MASDNRGPEYLVILVVMISMALTATLLRIIVRTRIVKAFGRDDWFMMLAMLTYIMYTICAVGGIAYGTGRRNDVLTPENTMKAMRFWWCCYVAYTTTMWFVKVSIGFFLLRLTVSRVHIRIIWTAMAATAITGIVFTFVTLFQCHPVSYFWTRFLGAKGQCMDIFIIINLTYFYSAVNALCDFTFGLLPIFLLWNLNMSLRMKLAIAPILSMACIASCAILVRTAYCRDYLKPDFLYATVDIAIWTTIECGLAITAGSLATLRPLFRVISNKLRSHATGGGPSSSGANNNNNNNNNSGSNKRPNTLWPSSTRSRDRVRGGPWSLLRTEHGVGYEMTAKEADAKVDEESVRTASASERGLVIEREIQVDVERSERREGDDAVGGQRRSWLQFKT